ncbi:MAG: 2OG-Fe(II) oxygenase [Fischerella sp.]|nr:2OG-Fe(II) oxygenase [Fischerella sp.]
MAIIPNSYYWLRSKTFLLDYLDSLRMQILSSPYLAASQLSESFAGTKGFSIVFKNSSISEVERHFPFFQPYLRVALMSACNAFYLNPLVIEGGSCVEPHVDCSLSEPGKFMAIPTIVSVLYVQVPPDLQGGELVLQERDRKVGKIQPQTNTLLYFRGNLTHSVNEVKSSQARISLVCEQYNLSKTRLQQIPEFEIQSRAVQRKYHN